MVELLVNLVVLIGLVIGSFTDLKTREVPDWLNFSLIALGFSINLLASLIFSDWHFIISSIFGFLVCLIIALLMYYTGQWGGGDSKMIMGLGALIGLPVFNFSIDSTLISFLINALLVGGVYGIFLSIFLSLKHQNKIIT